MTKLDHYPMTQEDVEIIGEEVCYQNFFAIKLYTLRHCLFNGGWSRQFKREVFERGPVAAVIPYDPVRDKVVLIEQFRVGCIQSNRSPWLLEIVAGIQEKNETVDDMIKRELKEEAGIIAEELIKLYEYWVSPGGSTEFLTFYCAKVDSSNAGGVRGVPEDQEDILVHIMDSELAFQKLANGDINNAATIIGLQWLKLNKDDIRQRWR